MFFSVSTYNFGIFNVLILDIFTPGIALIIPIAPLIILINPFTVFSIIPNNPLIPDLTAPLIAFPILVPMFENLSLIVFHNPPKKLPILLKIPVILFQASLNLSPNHPPTLENTFCIPCQAP